MSGGGRLTQQEGSGVKARGRRARPLGGGERVEVRDAGADEGKKKALRVRVRSPHPPRPATYAPRLLAKQVVQVLHRTGRWGAVSRLPPYAIWAASSRWKKKQGRRWRTGQRVEE